MARPRKSSTRVTLMFGGVLSGVLTGAVGCGRSDEPAGVRGKQYASKEECVADWGSPEDCEQRTVQHASGAHVPYFFYVGSGAYLGRGFGSAGAAGGGARGVDAPSRVVSRGGFGSSGHSSSS